SGSLEQGAIPTDIAPGPFEADHRPEGVRRVHTRARLSRRSRPGTGWSRPQLRLALQPPPAGPPPQAVERHGSTADLAPVPLLPVPLLSPPLWPLSASPHDEPSLPVAA